MAGLRSALGRAAAGTPRPPTTPAAACSVPPPLPWLQLLLGRRTPAAGVAVAAAGGGRAGCRHRRACCFCWPGVDGDVDVVPVHTHWRVRGEGKGLTHTAAIARAGAQQAEHTLWLYTCIHYCPTTLPAHDWLLRVLVLLIVLRVLLASVLLALPHWNWEGVLYDFPHEKGRRNQVLLVASSVDGRATACRVRVRAGWARTAWLALC